MGGNESGGRYAVSLHVKHAHQINLRNPTSVTHLFPAFSFIIFLFPVALFAAILAYRMYA